MDNGIPLGDNKLTCAMICESWGQQEDVWFLLMTDAFQGTDDLRLVIHVPKNNGMNRINIVEQVVKPRLKKHPFPLDVSVVESDDFTHVICDYWLMNNTFELYGNGLASRYGSISDPTLERIDACYSAHHKSKNPYEYDFLVDMYDVEKSNNDFEETTQGIIPKTFGSSGGKPFEDIMAVIRKKCDDKDRLLEIGCGAGAFYKTLLMNQFPHLYTGLDISRKQVLRCQKNYPKVDFRVGNVCALSLEDESFDFVFENNALIFTIDPLQAISEMVRVSRSYIRFTIHAVLQGKGIYCFYPFTHKVKMNPMTKAIKISEEEKRFFKGDIWHQEIGEDIMEAMVVKAPIYIPGIEEIDEFINKLMINQSVSIVRKDTSFLEKVIWINDSFSSKNVALDDCVVSQTDRKEKIDVDVITIVFEKIR